MKNRFLIAFLFIAIGTYLTGCYNDNEQSLYGKGNIVVCDTTAATFTAVISPIIVQNCAVPGCHTNSSYQFNGGINLEGYANIQKFIKADNGTNLFGTIRQLPGHSPMPKNGIKLPDCTINKLQAWFNRGYLNN